MPQAGFRGTTRYASLNAHRNIELGRVDDLCTATSTSFLDQLSPIPRLYGCQLTNVCALRNSILYSAESSVYSAGSSVFLSVLC